jgi:hypothetical protein
MVHRVIQAVLVAQEGAQDGTRLQQPVPVVVPRQAAHLQAEDKADVVETDLGHEVLEPLASFGLIALRPWSSSMMRTRSAV